MVSTTQTNKPINPRGNDQSPKGYNRAALYSGKALDFDGVNDYVEGSAPSLPTGANAFTTCFYFNKDADGEAVFWGTRSTNQSNGVGLFSGNKVVHFFYGNDLNSSSNIENGKWYFVAVTFDGTTRSIYINGQFDISDTPTGVNVTGTDYKLGYGGAYYHNGRLANTKVFNVALTAAQVADLYNNPEKVVPTGVDNTALKLWLPMQEGAGTTAYDGSSTENGPNLIVNGDFATDSDWTKGAGWSIGGGVASHNSSLGPGDLYQDFNLTIGKSYKITIEITATDTTELYFMTDSGDYVEVTGSPIGVHSHIFVADDSVHRVGVRGSGNWDGSVDNITLEELNFANHGTISGATWTHGIGAPVSQTAVIDWNKLYDFDGVDDNARVVSYADTTGTKSYKVHFIAHDVDSEGQIFQIFNYSSAKGAGATIDFLGTNNGTLGMRGFKNGLDYDIQSWSVEANTYYELAFTINWDTDTIVSATLNGEAATGSVSARLDTANNGLCLGARIGTYYLNGIINYFEVVGEEKWTNASGFKSESGSYDMTISGSPTQILAPQGLTSGRDITGVNLFENVRKQGALNLDGNSWADVHDNASLDFGSGSWTLEAWAYVETTYTAKGILSRWYSASQGPMMWAFNGNFQIYQGQSSGASSTAISTPIPSNGWHHIVGTFDSSDNFIRVYLNGVLKNTSGTITNPYGSNTLPLEIGRINNDSSTEYPNDIAQPRIYNRALTAEEVERNYNAGKNIYQ